MLKRREADEKGNITVTCSVDAVSRLENMGRFVSAAASAVDLP